MYINEYTKGLSTHRQKLIVKHKGIVMPIQKAFHMVFPLKSGSLFFPCFCGLRSNFYVEDYNYVLLRVFGEFATKDERKLMKVRKRILKMNHDFKASLKDIIAITHLIAF